jgi:AbiU2
MWRGKEARHWSAEEGVPFDMANPAAEFEHQLEAFRTDAQAAAQLVYAHLAIHAAYSDDQAVHYLIDQSGLLWRTIVGALQTSTFIVLGRIFDQGSAHNVDRLLKIAQSHPGIFSKESLGKRKQGSLQEPPEWLPAFLERAYVPKEEDFRRLRSHVRKRRKIYDDKYRELRRKVFAHKELADRGAISALFGKTSIRELERLVTFFVQLYEALQELFLNGKRPTLRPHRYSLARIRSQIASGKYGDSVQERIARETEQFLRAAVSAKQAMRR